MEVILMAFNPFYEKPDKIENTYRDWKQLYQKAYNKNEVNPYTKVRIILAQGAEFEANWFSHQFSRHCANNEVRRELAFIRRSEQMQQKAIASLKPIDESIIETTISYEQLAVDLTALMAQNETDEYIRQTLDFALLEDFDHLYRFADLLEMEHGIKGERLVGSYTEIMPGRPTIAEHRCPADDIKRHISNKTANLITKLNTNIITAAEQQTMNYYMNAGSFYSSDLGRQLFAEIAMIEEQHVTHYGSLLDPEATWFESLLMHEYAECYVYYSVMQDETDRNIKALWERHLNDELTHLHLAAELLQKYENKDWTQVITNGEFPKLISFEDNIQKNKQYVRNTLKNTVNNTAILEDFVSVYDLPDSYQFFRYNNGINGNPENVASHKVIESFINEFGIDYRFEENIHPVDSLRDRKNDNTEIGR